MTAWRIASTLLLLVLIALPAVLPFVTLGNQPQAWQALSETDRLRSLAGNTLALIAGTLALALPGGVCAAILLYRTDLPGRSVLRFLTLLALFVPLPLFTTAWQAALGTGGLFPFGFWVNPGQWQPWAQGLRAAVWIHVVAGLPWVILLVGHGLTNVERELEEDAALVAGPGQVLWHVTLPRARPTILAAGLWVALMTLTDITATDMMQVRTFAEEVYTQLVAGGRPAIAQAVAVSLPVVLVTWLVVLAVARLWARTLPPLEAAEPPRPVELGRLRRPAFGLALVVVAVLAGVPVVSLVWKLGLSGSPPAWSANVAAGHLLTAFQVRGVMVGQSLLLAGGAGALTAGLALVVSWLAVGSRLFYAGVLALAALVWALSGPIIGLGLKDVIGLLLDHTGSDGLATALYYGPSPLPVLWADLVRMFPFALAVIWPAVRFLPGELRDAARVDGASPQQELAHVVLPLTARATAAAVLAVAILSLGELSASKLVETPGWQMFAHEVFTQMHYGVSNDLAALCLVLLLMVLAGGAAFATLGRWLPVRTRLR